jgi:ribosomal protein RSM22 (predicted rRNA methylase)
MIEPHPALATVARRIAAALPALDSVTLSHEARRAEATALPEADLVIAAYVAVEQRDAELAAFTARLIAATRQALVLVEPGTPEGYRRLMLMRAQAIAAGLHVAAPCPHDDACPLLDSLPQSDAEKPVSGPSRTAGDWCHFSVRVQRSRLHRQVKQADMGHEDEKFSYVVLTHAIPPTRPARILSPPQVSKIGTDLKLCTASGIAQRHVASRDKAGSRAIRRLDWGDALPD